MAKLVVRSGYDTGREFPLVEGLNRIGRAPGNEILLDVDAISATHCEMWLMKERLLVRDLGSTNGVFVNGRSVGESELQEQDLLGIGGVELLVAGAPGRVEIPKPPEPPPPPRYTPDGIPCCVNHSAVPAVYRCRNCGEQFCDDCVRVLGRRGGARHAYCPLCSSECVKVVPPRLAAVRSGGRPGWLAKLTQTLRLGR